MKTHEELFEEFKQIQYGGNKWSDYHEDDLECAFRYALEIGRKQGIEEAAEVVADEVYPISDMMLYEQILKLKDRP